MDTGELDHFMERGAQGFDAKVHEGRRKMRISPEKQTVGSGDFQIEDPGFVETTDVEKCVPTGRVVSSWELATVF